MLCENCGTRVSETDTNCPVCGLKIERDSKNNKGVTKSLNIENPPNNKKKIITVCSLVIVCLIAVMAIVIAITNKNNIVDTTSNTTTTTSENSIMDNYPNDVEEQEEYDGFDNYNTTTDNTENDYNYSDDTFENDNQYIEFNTYEINKLPVANLTVDKIVSNSTVVDKSSKITYNGNINAEDQKDEYVYTVAIDGRLRVELSEIKSGAYMGLYVINSLGETVDYDDYCYNGEGVTLKGLEAGQEYEVQVRYASGKGDYNISVGKQKEIIDDETVIVIKIKK